MRQEYDNDGKIDFYDRQLEDIVIEEDEKTQREIDKRGSTKSYCWAIALTLMNLAQFYSKNVLKKDIYFKV